jgi:hypothetical protein
MLTQPEFAALLQRYAADNCTVIERQIVDKWLAQYHESIHTTTLTATELTQTKAIMWEGLKTLLSDNKP